MRARRWFGRPRPWVARPGWPRLGTVLAPTSSLARLGRAVPCAGSARDQGEIGLGSAVRGIRTGSARTPALREIGAGPRTGSARDQHSISDAPGACEQPAWVRSARPRTVRPARRAGPARWNRRCCRSVMQPAHGSHAPTVAFGSGMHPVHGCQEAAVAFRSDMHPVHGSHAPTVAFGSGMHPANGCQEAAVAFGSDMHPVHGCPRSAGRRSLRRAEPSTGRGRAPDPRPAGAAPGAASDADHA
jgi:hypothetical protein